MTLSSDQFHERLIGYLYGELEGEELRAFEEYLRDSEEGRRELASLQTTLRMARDGLAQAVDEPPVRVRSAVLAAAAAQLQAAKPLRAARATRVDEQGGFSRWLRATWLVPSLGVAAAVALVVFGKNIESPRARVDEHAARPTAVPEQSPASPPPSAAASESDKVEEKGRQPAVDARQAPAKASRSNRAGARSKDDDFAVPPPAWNAKRVQPSRAQPEPRSAPAAGAAREPHAEAEREELLVPDRPRAARSVESIGRVDPRGAASEKSEGADVLDDLSALERPAPAAPASSAARASSVAPASSAARAPAQDAPAEAASELQRNRADAKIARAPNELVRRAGEHLAARRWQQAVTDYRELLRRYPNDSRVLAWKKQLELAAQALRGAMPGRR
jgi:hypothetical protein